VEGNKDVIGDDPSLLQKRVRTGVQATGKNSI
jgi:hypothetical protein